MPTVRSDSTRDEVSRDICSRIPFRGLVNLSMTGITPINDLPTAATETGGSGAGGTARVLLDRDLIARRVAELGQQIARELREEDERLVASGQVAGPVVMVPVLTGAIVFVADLIRAMNTTMTIKPVTVTSYPGKATASQGATLQHGLPTDLKSKRVLLVDDILDSGQTLGLLRRVIMAQNPQSLRTIVLLDKEKSAGRTEEVPIEHAAFKIADEFVIGYGLDFDGKFRNLPDIMTLSESQA